MSTTSDIKKFMDNISEHYIISFELLMREERGLIKLLELEVTPENIEFGFINLKYYYEIGYAGFISIGANYVNDRHYFRIKYIKLNNEDKKEFISCIRYDCDDVRRIDKAINILSLNTTELTYKISETIRSEFSYYDEDFEKYMDRNDKAKNRVFNSIDFDEAKFYEKQNYIHLIKSELPEEVEYTENEYMNYLAVKKLLVKMKNNVILITNIRINTERDKQSSSSKDLMIDIDLNKLLLFKGDLNELLNLKTEFITLYFSNFKFNMETNIIYYLIEKEKYGYIKSQKDLDSLSNEEINHLKQRSFNNHKLISNFGKSEPFS